MPSVRRALRAPLIAVLAALLWLGLPANRVGAADADMTVQKAIAKFRGPSRKGTPRDTLKLSGDLARVSAFTDFDAAAEDLFAALGPIVLTDFQADPVGESTERPKLRKGRLKHTRRIGRTRIKLTVDLRRSSFKLKVSRGDLSELARSSPFDVTFALAAGDTVLEDKFSFDGTRSDRWLFRNRPTSGGGSPGGGQDDPDRVGVTLTATLVDTGEWASPSVRSHRIGQDAGEFARIMIDAFGPDVRLPAAEFPDSTAIGLFLWRRPFFSRRSVELVSVERFDDGDGRVTWREVVHSDRWPCVGNPGGGACPDRYPTAVYLVQNLPGDVVFVQAPDRVEE